MTLIRHTRTQGVGGAIITGHRRRLELGADINVIMAGEARWTRSTCPTCWTRWWTGARASRRPTGSSPRILQRMPRLPDLRQHRAVVPDQAGLGVLAPVRPAERLHRDHPGRPARGPARPGRLALLVRERPAHPPEHPAVPAIDVPIPAVYGERGLQHQAPAGRPRTDRLLFAGFWKRFFYKYVLWSFSPIALFLFSGLFLILFGPAGGSGSSSETLGPRSPRPDRSCWPSCR